MRRWLPLYATCRRADFGPPRSSNPRRRSQIIGRQLNRLATSLPVIAGKRRYSPSANNTSAVGRAGLGSALREILRQFKIVSVPAVQRAGIGLDIFPSRTVRSDPHACALAIDGANGVPGWIGFRFAAYVLANQIAVHVVLAGGAAARALNSIGSSSFGVARSRCLVNLRSNSSRTEIHSCRSPNSSCVDSFDSGAFRVSNLESPRQRQGDSCVWRAADSRWVCQRHRANCTNHCL